MSKPDDLSKPLVALDHDSTLVCVIEMSGTSWLVAATVPGVDRRPLQRLPVNPERLLEQVERWRQEAARAGRTITHTVVAYESGRDGFGAEIGFGCQLERVWRQPRCREPVCRTSTTNRAVTKSRRPKTKVSNWR